MASGGRESPRSPDTPDTRPTEQAPGSKAAVGAAVKREREVSPPRVPPWMLASRLHEPVHVTPFNAFGPRDPLPPWRSHPGAGAAAAKGGGKSKSKGKGKTGDVRCSGRIVGVIAFAGPAFACVPLRLRPTGRRAQAVSPGVPRLQPASASPNVAPTEEVGEDVC